MKPLANELIALSDFSMDVNVIHCADRSDKNLRWTGGPPLIIIVAPLKRRFSKKQVGQRGQFPKPTDRVTLSAPSRR